MQPRYLKQVGVVLSVLILTTIIFSLPQVRVQYHKWRLESGKARKTRLLANAPSAFDRLRLLLGTPVSGQQLDAAVREHERALVHLGFLDQTKLPAEMVSECPQTLETLTDLKSRCHWYHEETLSGSNLVVTACPKMMDLWRQRAKELGWSVPKS